MPEEKVYCKNEFSNWDTMCVCSQLAKFCRPWEDIPILTGRGRTFKFCMWPFQQKSIARTKYYSKPFTNKFLYRSSRCKMWEGITVSIPCFYKRRDKNNSPSKNCHLRKLSYPHQWIHIALEVSKIYTNTKKITLFSLKQEEIDKKCWKFHSFLTFLQFKKPVD